LERTPSPHPVTVGDVAPAASAATEPRRRISSSGMLLSSARAGEWLPGSNREQVRLTATGAALDRRRWSAGDAIAAELSCDDTSCRK